MGKEAVFAVSVLKCCVLLKERFAELGLGLKLLNLLLSWPLINNYNDRIQY